MSNGRLGSVAASSIGVVGTLVVVGVGLKVLDEIQRQSNKLVKSIRSTKAPKRRVRRRR